MAKSDLRARPMFHHEADSIHVHLRIVFTALAILRHLQDTTGVSIRKIVRTLRPLRDVTINIGGNEITSTTPPGAEHAILTAAAGHQLGTSQGVVETSGSLAVQILQESE